MREDLLAGRDRHLGPVGGRQGRDPRRLAAEGVVAQDHALLPLPAGGRQRDGADARQIGEDVAAVDVVVLFPEPALHLQADLVHRRVADPAHRLLKARRDVHRDVLRHRQGDGADAVVGADLPLGALRPGVGDGHARRRLLDLVDDGLVVDHALGDVAHEAAGDLVHAAHRLEHGPLLVVGGHRRQHPPGAGAHEVGQGVGL